MNIFTIRYFLGKTLLLPMFRFFLLLVIFLSIFLGGTSCSPNKLKVEEFSLCQQLGDGKCIPPLVLTKTAYYFSNPDVSSSLQSYFDSLIATQKILAFEIKFNRSFTKEEKIDLQKNTTAFYFIKNSSQDSKEENSTSNSQDKAKKFLFSEIQVHKKSITAWVSVGEIFKTAFVSVLQTPYKKLKPVRIVIEVYRKNILEDDSKNKTDDTVANKQERLVKRTINIEIHHENKNTLNKP